MGWLSMPLASMGSTPTPKSYLDAQFTYERKQDDGSTTGLRILRSSCVGTRVYYAATQTFERRDGKETTGVVFAVVCLVRWTPRAKDGYVFGYKSMDESMGPCEDHCPEAILTLLGPTVDESAIDWRRRCLANLKRRLRPIADGAKVKLASPITFIDGYVGDEFTVQMRGRRLVFVAPTGDRYSISRFRERAWSLIPQTTIHAPIFAKRA